MLCYSVSSSQPQSPSCINLVLSDFSLETLGGCVDRLSVWIQCHCVKEDWLGLDQAPLCAFLISGALSMTKQWEVALSVIFRSQACSPHPTGIKKLLLLGSQALAPSNWDVSLRNPRLPSELSDVCYKHKSYARLSELEGAQQRDGHQPVKVLSTWQGLL